MKIVPPCQRNLWLVGLSFVVVVVVTHSPLIWSSIRRHRTHAARARETETEQLMLNLGSFVFFVELQPTSWCGAPSSSRPRKREVQVVGECR